MNNNEGITALYQKCIPEWLMAALAEQDRHRTPFPLKEILQDALFYPACGFDAAPIKHLIGNFYSFVYADYGIADQDLETRIKTHGFKGYQLQLNMAVDVATQLSPALVTLPSHLDPNRFIVPLVKPYARWYVFKSNDTDKLFSLLYLGMDGVASYQHLYVKNNICPRAIAVIRPGTGFGNNWTNFRDTDGPLADAVFRSGLNIPNYFINGGGTANLANSACWSVSYPNPLLECKTFGREGFVVFGKTDDDNDR